MSSNQQIRSEVDLFSPPIVDVSLDASEFQKFYPTASVKDNANPVEFNITGSNSKYIDLYNSFIYIKARVTLQDGTKLPTGEKIAPGNLFFHNIFQICSVALNSIVVSDTSNYYPYQPWVQNQLSYGSTTKDGELTTEIYYKDSSPDEYDPAKNPGFKTRMEIAADFEMIEKLSLGLFQQKRYLPPNVAIFVCLRISPPEFALASAVTSESGVSGCPYQIKLDEAIFYVRKHLLNLDVVAQHQRLLDKNERFLYPYRRAQVKSFVIPTGSLGTTNELVFSGDLPELLTVGLVSSKAAQGSLDKNPFNFNTFGLKSITVTLDDEAVVYRAINFDFANNQYLLGYNAMFKAAQNPFIGNSLKREDFYIGNVLAVFDLIPSNGVGVFHRPRSGQVKIEFTFANELTEPLNAIIYGQFQEQIEIDKHRNVTVHANDG